MSWDQDLFKRTIDFAAMAHGPQTMQGSPMPYVVHLVKVATEVLCVHREGDFDVNFAMQCALLHDAMEDAGVSTDAIAKAFSEKVAAGVAALTKNENLAPELRMADSLERIRRQPLEVWMVKMADRITNLEPAPAHWSNEKRLAYRDEALSIHNALRSAHAGLARRLENKIASYV